METALERRLLEPHDLGRVISAEPFDVTQDERRTVPLGQGPDGPLEHLPEVVLLGARLRSVREVRSLLERPLFDRERLGRRAAPCSSLGLVEPDAIQPREELRAALEAVDASPRAQERFSDDLLGLS